MNDVMTRCSSRLGGLPVLLGLVVAAWLPGAVLAQAPTAAAKHDDPLSADALRATLSWLADDARCGRDSPSPGLDAAAEYLARRFEAAGLKPAGDDGTWFEAFTERGRRLSSKGLQVTVHSKVEDVVLEPGKDVRPLQVSAAFHADHQAVVRLAAEEAGGRRRSSRGDAPILVEVAEDTPLWRMAETDREVLGRHGGRVPVLMVRKGVLPDGDDLTATLDVPGPAAVDVRLRNVVGRLPGGARADEIVMVSAHYDHIGLGLPKGGDEVYNGADDDASGTTAVVAIADALGHREQPLARTCLFVCFAAEEKGLLGSEAFAKDPPVPLKSIAAAVNIEMLGRPWKPRTAWITGRTLSDFEAIAAPALAREHIACGEFPQEAMLFRASDNLPLARQGVVAHTISASSLHADYHGLDDEVDRIDFENLAAVVHGIEQVVVDFASREKPPAYNEAGMRTLGLDH